MTSPNPLDHFVLEGLPGGLGHVLHVGPGAAPPDWRGAGATGVTFVEPDPDAVEALRTAAGEGVRVIQAALTAAGGGRQTLHRFTFPGLNALRKPTGLRELFPGLTERPAEIVDLCDPVTLVGELALPNEGSHVLVLEAPGEGLAALEALAQAGLLSCFSRVVVQEGREELYQGGATIGEIETRLQKAGFTERSHAGNDPDRPHLRADRDLRGEELKRLREEQATLIAERDALRAERTALVAERDALRDAVTAERERLEEQRALGEDHLARTREEMLKAEGQIEFLRELLLTGDRS